MRERSNRAVSKTVVPPGTGGSNPPLSVFRICASGFGKMSEWSKVHAWKACVPERVPRVRIPLFPSLKNNKDSFDESRCYARQCFRTPSGPKEFCFFLPYTGLFLHGGHNAAPYYSRIRPSTDIVITCHGMNLPLSWSAFRTAASRPPQQGTSMRTTVTPAISLCAIMRVSFSL